MAIPCPELDDSEKLLLSREMSENDGIERGRNQAIRQGTSSREKQARGDKVRTLAGTFLHRTGWHARLGYVYMYHLHPAICHNLLIW